MTAIRRTVHRTAPRRIGAALAAPLVTVATLAAGAAPADAAAPAPVTRLAGTDRYDTARQVALAGYPNGAPAAVLALGERFPDALAGAYLAGANAAPVLLTGGDSLHPAAEAALGALGTTTVHVLGSTAAIGQPVVAALQEKGLTVHRIGGVDRYATAAAIAQTGEPAKIRTLPGKGRIAFVASGTGFADALAAGPLSAADRIPTLLTPPESLHPASASALSALGVQHVVLLGGTAAVSDGIRTSIEGAGMTVERLAGADRYATAAAIAGFATSTLGWAVDDLVLATGTRFADALAAGPLAGGRSAPVVLTADGLPLPSATVCAEHAPALTSLVVAGGLGAVPESVVVACNGGASDGPQPEPQPDPQPDPQPVAAAAWALLDNPIAAETTPTPAYQFLSSGGTATTLKLGPGRWRTTFPGMGSSGGVVHVGTYASVPAHCVVATWAHAGADLRVDTACTDPAGAPADVHHLIRYAKPVAGSTGLLAHLWANDAVAAESTPSPQYSFNATGGTNTMLRSGVGAYTLRLPGLAGENGTVQVTAYGVAGKRCTAQSWGPDGADQLVDVRCRDAADAPVDSLFTLSFTRGGAVTGLDRPSGYVWGHLANTAQYDATPSYSFNSTGATNTVTREATGVYVVRLPGVPGGAGHAEAAAYGDASSSCQVGNWVESAGTALRVRCFDGAGAPADTRFVAAFTA